MWWQSLHREKQLIEQYQQYLRTNGIEGEARVKTIAIRDTSIPEGIIAAADEAEADVVVLGIGNYTTKKLGSMSDYVLHHCSRSVMVLKDAVEVSDCRGLTGANKEFLASETLGRNLSISKTITMGRRVSSGSLDIKPHPHPFEIHSHLPTIPSLASLEISN